MLHTSVIICTRNRPQEVASILTSLKLQTVQPTEILIIDSSSVQTILNPCVAHLWSSFYFPHSQLIYHHTQAGLTYQRNEGVTLSSGEIMYFFDDDVVLTKTYLERMNLVFLENPEYLGGMGTILPLSSYKPWVNIARALFFLQRNYSHGNFTISGMPTHAYGGKELKKVEALGGCCMAFRSSVFKHCSFDQALRLYGYMEDCDFSYRISRVGPLFFNPLAQLEHRQSPFNRDSIVDNKAMFIANYTYLFFKNFYPQNRLKVCAYMWSIIGLLLEAIIIVRDTRWIQGYIKGLLHAIKCKAQRPLP